MNPKIIDMPTFSVVGIKRNFSTINGENFKQIPQFWAELGANGTLDELGKLSSGEPFGPIGVCADMTEDNLEYWIAAVSSAEPTNCMEKIEVSACTWAIFEAIGAMPTSIQEIFCKIFEEWLPSSEYEHANAPDFEVYSLGDMSSPDYKSWAWIPVVKKK